MWETELKWKHFKHHVAGTYQIYNMQMMWQGYEYANIWPNFVNRDVIQKESEWPFLTSLVLQTVVALVSSSILLLAAEGKK